MADTRRKNTNWALPEREPMSFEGAQLAVLMDIRDELQTIRARLDCGSTLAIPRYLRRISANTAKPRRKKR